MSPNVWRMCLQFWLSVRNSVWGPFNRDSGGSPLFCWLGRGGGWGSQKSWTKLLWTNWRFLVWALHRRITSTPDHNTSEKYHDTPPISVAILLQKSALVWQKVVFTARILIAICPQFVSQYCCWSIGVRDRWNTPKMPKGPERHPGRIRNYPHREGYFLRGILQIESNMHWIEGHHLATPFAPNFTV